MPNEKLALCMIVKDEADMIRRCLESAKSAVDEINVLITSSDKKTWDTVLEYTDNVAYFEWCDDFAKARNASFAMASTDFILWLDSDDVLLNGPKVKECFNTFFTGNPNSLIMLQYNYEYDVNGLLTAQHWRERVVNRQTVTWKGRIHETFIPNRPLHVIKYEDAAVDHLHAKSSEQAKHERNLSILLQSYEDDPGEARTIYYIGSTLLGLAKYDEAITWLKRYIAISGWDEEKYVACIRIADCYLKLNNKESASAFALKAVSIKSTYPDAYFKLAQIAYQSKQYKETVHWVETLLRLKPQDTEIIRNPRNYDYNPLLLLSEALFELDRFDECLAALHKIKAFTPDLEAVDYKISLCDRAKRIKQAEQAYTHLVEYCIQNEELGKAEKIAELMPIDIRNLPKAVQKRFRAQRIMNRIRNYDKGVRETPPGMTFNIFPDVETEKKYHALLVQLVQHPEVNNILDVGCFNGWMANDLCQRGWNVTGVDIGQEGLDVARKVAEEKQTKAKFQQCKYKDVGDKFFRQFDAVTCFDVLEHVLDPQDLIKQLELACKPDGWIFLNVPNGAWHKGNMDTENVEYYEHIASYEYQDLAKLFNGRKNLKILKWDSEHPRAILSPGQSGLFVAYQNDVREGRDITIFCGATPEAWSPKNEKTGIGGSEEAVINISRELVKLGNRVKVYCNCGSDAGVYQDVPYLHYEEFDPFAKYDVLIGWRNPTFFTMPIEAKQKYLWLHDVPNVMEFSEDVVNAVEKIFVLSKWHRDCLPQIQDNKFFLTRNGINMSYFDKYKDVVRNPYKVVYSSSPDRGLDKLLEIWGEVKKEVPEAELHVFYGWGVFDSIRRDPASLNWKKHVMSLMNQPGVINHGRVGHEELAKEYCEAGIWAYPTYFTEISCITAMKAQLAGVIPVCTDVAALDETVQHGIKLRGSILEPGNLEMFTKQLIEVLKNPRPDVKPMQDWARNQFGWDTLAQDWENLFNIKSRRK